jgi:transcriptional regulator of acetoin/glycerol metabolism
VALGVGEALLLHRSDDARSPPGAPGAAARDTSLPPNPFATVPLDQIYKHFREQWAEHGERVYLEHLLEAHDGNVAVVAEHAGLDRTHVYRLLRKHRR